MLMSYSSEKALLDVLKSWPIGEKRTGRQINSCTHELLKAHGSSSNPMETTTLRLVRKYKTCFGIHAKKGVSEYVKLRVKENQ